MKHGIHKYSYNSVSAVFIHLESESKRYLAEYICNFLMGVNYFIDTIIPTKLITVFYI